MKKRIGYEKSYIRLLYNLKYTLIPQHYYKIFFLST